MKLYILGIFTLLYADYYVHKYKYNKYEYFYKKYIKK